MTWACDRIVGTPVGARKDEQLQPQVVAAWQGQSPAAAVSGL